MDESDAVYRCTLTRDAVAGRVEVDRALAARVVDTERSTAGVRVRFDDGRETRRLVDMFVANERRCCGFFDFTVTEAHDRVVLEITAPEADSAQQLVDAAKRVFDLGPDAVDPSGIARTTGG